MCVCVCVCVCIYVCVCVVCVCVCVCVCVYRSARSLSHTRIQKLFPSNKFEALETVAQEAHTHADNWSVSVDACLGLF